MKLERFNTNDFVSVAYDNYLLITASRKVKASYVIRLINMFYFVLVKLCKC